MPHCWKSRVMAHICITTLYRYPLYLDTYPPDTESMVSSRTNVVQPRNITPELVDIVARTKKGHRKKHHAQKTVLPVTSYLVKISKGAKIRNRYNQVPHLTQDTNGKVINLQLDTTNEGQEVSPFPAVDHKAHINIRVQRHSKHKTEQKHKKSTKEVRPWNGQ